jgi:hypothetical protein
VKIALYVEGQTERHLPEFLKRWLDPRLPQKIRIYPVLFEGVADYLRHFAGRVARDVNGGNLAGAIGLIDLYGSGLPYPDGTAKEKYAWAKQRLEAQVADSRFRQHFAVHETEAWLFSQPDIFPAGIAGGLPKTPQPETVNFEHPPSYRLRDLYWRKLHRKYRKPIEGSRLFQKLNPEVACARCPHLKLLLEDILAVAKTATS